MESTTATTATTAATTATTATTATANKKMLAAAAKMAKKAIKADTVFVAPKKTYAVSKDWLCQGVPCYIINRDETTVELKPFNKNGNVKVSQVAFEANFEPLQRDTEYVYTSPSTSYYLGNKVALAEFEIKPLISLTDLIKPFKDTAPIFADLLGKAFQDAYTSKGNNSCLTIAALNAYEEGAGTSGAGTSGAGTSGAGTSTSAAGTSASEKKPAKLERVGDPVFNRSTRHTMPIPRDFERADYERSPSFPAPMGVRNEDFAWPSEQNQILVDMVTQLFNCVQAPACPTELKEQLQLTGLKPNSHQCDWCGEKLDISQADQSYSAKEHSINFCHRDPLIGTKSGNVYFGHTRCNREQGGYSEEQRIAQIIRLAKTNPAAMEQLRKGLGF